MSSSSSSPTKAKPCYLLTLLPLELRAQIYSHVLHFSSPLRLRHIVAGSPHTALLRTNSQIHAEALPIFYHLNTILCSRADFCLYNNSNTTTTTPALPSPLQRKDHIRHLGITTFSPSIKCSSYSGGNHLFLAGCCEICQPTGLGFLHIFTSGHLFPHLKSVVLDIRTHRPEFDYVRDVIRRHARLETLRRHRDLVCTGVGEWTLRGTAIVPDGLRVVFRDGVVHAVWARWEAVQGSITSVYGMPGEEAMLGDLRDEFGGEVPDQLYFMFCARKSIMWPGVLGRLAEKWGEMEEGRRAGRDVGEAMEALYAEIVHSTPRQSVTEAKMLLVALRSEETRLMGMMRMS